MKFLYHFKKKKMLFRQDNVVLKRTLVDGKFSANEGIIAETDANFEAKDKCNHRNVMEKLEDRCWIIKSNFANKNYFYLLFILKKSGDRIILYIILYTAQYDSTTNRSFWIYLRYFYETEVQNKPGLNWSRSAPKVRSLILLLEWFWLSLTQRPRHIK